MSACLAILALGAALNAGAAVVYRCVDEEGKTHFGNSVPAEYRAVARPVDSAGAMPGAQAQRQAMDRAEAEKDRALRSGRDAP